MGHWPQDRVLAVHQRDTLGDADSDDDGEPDAELFADSYDDFDPNCDAVQQRQPGAQLQRHA